MSDTPSTYPSLRILACLKQVRLPKSSLELREGRAVWPQADLFKMSNADEYALEEALCLKDALPGTTVTALTLGPASAQAILRRALGMGADEAIHLDAEQDELRPSQIAAAIAAWAGARPFDLILCGVMSEDAMAGVVGPWLAELLGLACATSVVTLEPLERGVRVEREMGGGMRQALELPLPALLTIQSSRRTPRYPTLSSLLKAKKAALPTLRVTDLGLAPIKEGALGLHLPESRRAGLVLEGAAQEKASRLRDILRERALL